MKKKDKEVTHETLAQDIVPLNANQGVFMRLDDGKTNIGIEVEGINDSLYTYEQKHDEALEFASCLTAVRVPFSIIKLPRPIDSNAFLIQTDHEIMALRDEIISCHDPVQTKVLKTRLYCLEEYIRPEAVREALEGDRIEYPTYFILQFDKNTPDKMILSDVQVLLDRLHAAGRSAKLCHASKLLEMQQLFFKPGSIGPGFAEGKLPVMAKGA